MTVHLFPSGRMVSGLPDPSRKEPDAPVAEPDRTELWLIAGLIAITAAQAALIALFWL